MRRTWRKAAPKQEKRFFVNEQIRAVNIFLIDESGENVGVVATSDALQRAHEADLDLVEVNPQGDTPVCKIMDYGQFKYEREKKAHKQKIAQKKVDTKGIRLSVRISKNDLDMRVNQAYKFLEKGNKLKLEMILKGRERAHPEKAVEIINNFLAELSAKEGINLVKEQDLTKQGGRFIMVLINKND